MILISLILMRTSRPPCTVPMSTVTHDTDYITRGIQTMPIDQPQEAKPPDVVEMRSSGPWPETEINTTSGNEARDAVLLNI